MDQIRRLRRRTPAASAPAIFGGGGGLNPAAPGSSMYAENVVQLMNDATFKARFRISRYTMDALVRDPSRRLVDCGSVRHPSIDPRKQVLMTVYTLAHQCSYRYTC